MINSSVTDKDLIETAVLLKCERIKRVSIFPFFSESGKVHQLMIILPDDDNIHMVPFKKNLAIVSFFKGVKLSMSTAELKSFNDFSENQVADLFHYDPNFILVDEKYSHYRLSELISTNCADSVKVSELRFSSDLSLLNNFAMKSGPCMFRTIEPEKLLARLGKNHSNMRKSPVESECPKWQLDPIWNHWSKS